MQSQLFLIFFTALMSMLMIRPKGPWIIVTTIIGCIYGWVTSKWAEGIKPFLLRDKYPSMGDIT